MAGRRLTRLVALAGAGCAAGWVRARAGAEADRELARAAERELAAARERHGAEQERHKRALRRRDEAVEHGRELIERLKRSRRAEREFNLELREQLGRAGQTEEGDGEQDVRSLVLRTAIKLAAAEKGLLLSRSDADGDGELDLVTAHGFEHDPEHSAVAQRFARRVLAADETVREDDVSKAQDPEHPVTDADREIDSLVALPVYLHDSFHGVVICANREGGFEELDDDLLLALGDHAGTVLHTERLRGDLAGTERSAVRMLGEAAGARDPELRRQSAAVAMYAGALGRRLDLPQREREALVSAALLRDVGALAVPERILQKPGPLTPEERSVVELHPRLGFDVLQGLPALRPAAFAVLHHHERFDGEGYPAGLSGPEIPLPARVIAVVDAFVALTHDRPHRPARSHEQAVAELQDAAGTQLDPELCALFVRELAGVEPASLEPLADAILEGLPLPAPVTGPGREAEEPAIDSLTRLPALRALSEAVGSTIAGARDGHGPALVVVELADLGRINQEQGYEAGDRLLMGAARRVQRCALRSGGGVYRASGRRLAVLVPEASDSELDRLGLELNAEFALGGPAVRVGTAVWHAGQGGDELLAAARGRLAAEA